MLKVKILFYLLLAVVYASPSFLRIAQTNALQPPVARNLLTQVRVPTKRVGWTWARSRWNRASTKIKKNQT